MKIVALRSVYFDRLTYWDISKAGSTLYDYIFETNLNKLPKQTRVYELSKLCKQKGVSKYIPFY